MVDIRQGGVRPQERAPDYRVVAAWSAFLIFIGAGAFVIGLAIHNEATAKPPAPRPWAFATLAYVFVGHYLN